MPELPEVETVKETLKKHILGKTIIDVNVLYSNIIAKPNVDEFIKKIVNQKINDIIRKGKWLIFVLDEYYLLSHLRMEGKYFLKDKESEITKHQHVIFDLGDIQLRYNDTRKFGKMYLLEKEKAFNEKPLNEIGLEPWELDLNYLKNKFNSKSIPIKTVLLDQTIIAGIGNIYADEILFLSKINPYIKTSLLTNSNLEDIINYSKSTLEKAIKLGGTTIKSYTSSEGVHGKFQNELLVHSKKICPECKNDILKVKIGGRGTYYCSSCQKKC